MRLFETQFGSHLFLREKPTFHRFLPSLRSRELQLRFANKGVLNVPRFRETIDSRTALKLERYMCFIVDFYYMIHVSCCTREFAYMNL